MPGYGTDQQYLYLLERGLAFFPDLVLLLFHPNDVLNNTYGSQYGYSKPVYELAGSRDQDSGELELLNQPVPPPGLLDRIERSLVRRSYLLYRLWSTARRFTGNEISTQDLHAAPRLAHDVTEALLLEMSELAKRNGSALAIVGIP